VFDFWYYPYCLQQGNKQNVGASGAKLEEASISQGPVSNLRGYDRIRRYYFNEDDFDD